MIGGARARYTVESYGLGPGASGRGPVELSYVHAAARTMVGGRGLEAVRAAAAEGAVVAQGWDDAVLTAAG